MVEPTTPESPTPKQVEVVCRELAGELFPWDTTRSLELALLKTFCVPSISDLLQRTVNSPTDPASATTTPA